MKPVDILGYLDDILENARRLNTFVGDMTYEQFIVDDKTIWAVERAVEIIGEAAKRLPEDFRQQFPHIPWRRMAGMRDVVSHAYRTISRSVLYRVATVDVDLLTDGLPPIIAKLTSMDDD